MEILETGPYVVHSTVTLIHAMKLCQHVVMNNVFLLHFWFRKQIWYTHDKYLQDLKLLNR